MLPTILYITSFFYRNFLPLLSILSKMSKKNKAHNSLKSKSHFNQLWQVPGNQGKVGGGSKLELNVNVRALSGIIVFVCKWKIVAARRWPVHSSVLIHVRLSQHNVIRIPSQKSDEKRSYIRSLSVFLRWPDFKPRRHPYHQVLFNKFYCVLIRPFRYIRPTLTCLVLVPVMRLLSINKSRLYGVA